MALLPQPAAMAVEAAVAPLAPVAAVAAVTAVSAVTAEPAVPSTGVTRTYAIVGDGIPDSLSGTAGDASRGRTVVATRQIGLCLLCHAGPIAEERFQGTLAPDLSGAGSRWSAAQLRLRLVDSRKLNPASIMPSYFRTDGFARVGKAWAGKTILSAEQIEDVIAYLLTLKATRTDAN